MTGRYMGAAARRYTLAGLALAMVLGAGARAAEPELRLPCGPDAAAAAPAYADAGGAPAVGIWHDVDLGPDACLGLVEGHFALAVALAVRFRHRGGLGELAARIGAVSGTAGMRYWSVTDADWRPLISEAAAVTGAAGGTPRPGFTAEEVLGGQVLTFVQDDTRSSGLNPYSLTGRRLGPDAMAAVLVTLDTIRYLGLPLYGAGALVSLHVLRRLEGDEWGYYGFSAVRDGAGTGHERSWVNRAAAYQRLLTGEATDGAPPLAP